MHKFEIAVGLGSWMPQNGHSSRFVHRNPSIGLFPSSFAFILHSSSLIRHNSRLYGSMLRGKRDPMWDLFSIKADVFGIFGQAIMESLPIYTLSPPYKQEDSIFTVSNLSFFYRRILFTCVLSVQPSIRRSVRPSVTKCQKRRICFINIIRMIWDMTDIWRMT